MTEQEAMEMLYSFYEMDEMYAAAQIAIKALEEVQQYREIGTVEECRAAVEKQTAAKPLCGEDIKGNEYAICRECSAILSDGEWFAQYCPDCGKKVDWRDEE